MMDDIRGSEEVLALTFDTTRNRVMYLNLFATSGALVVGTGAMIAGIFGMNLEIEEHVATWNLVEEISPLSAIYPSCILCTYV